MSNKMELSDLEKDILINLLKTGIKSVGFEKIINKKTGEETTENGKPVFYSEKCAELIRKLESE